MWCAPDEVLSKLKCFMCDLYVKGLPIYSAEEGLLCEWCSGLVPTNSAEYVRQCGLELLVPYILFPCKYNHFGCPKRACGEQLQEHEDHCKCRFKTLEKGISVASDETQLSGTPLDEPYTPHSINSSRDATSETKFFPIKSESKDLKAEMNCIAKGNKTTKKLTVLKYNINIISERNKQLCIMNNARRSKFLHSDYVKPIELRIDGAISLRAAPTSLYCNLKTISVEDDVHNVMATAKCKSCNIDYLGDKEHCGNGHTLCTSCKLTPCSECRKRVGSISFLKCTNFGCPWRGGASCLRNHQKDCINGRLLCAFDGCPWQSPELLMKTHLTQVHKQSVHIGDSVVNQFTLEDNIWIMLAFNKIFICKYYVYTHHIDFLVELFANCSSQSSFNFTVEILSENRNLVNKYSRRCSISNNSVLDAPVNVPLSDIAALDNKTLYYKLSIDFKIVPTDEILTKL